jgi:hypothetical protein
VPHVLQFDNVSDETALQSESLFGTINARPGTERAGVGARLKSVKKADGIAASGRVKKVALIRGVDFKAGGEWLSEQWRKEKGPDPHRVPVKLWARPFGNSDFWRRDPR